jgi:hypothetical protein
VLQVDASTSSVATGIKLKGGAAAGGMAVSVISGGTDENLTIDAKGAGTITLAGTSTGGIILSRDTTISDAKNIVLNTTTGTKIGTATSQKLSLWNATPIVQPTTAIAAATFAANTSGIANDTATFDGYTIGQIVKALRNIGALA